MDVQPRKPSLRGPEDWFTGEVSVDLITNGHGPTPLSLGNIRFSPGARTAWHAHSIAQTLYVTEGEGRVQARGEADQDRPPRRHGPRRHDRMALARRGT